MSTPQPPYNKKKLCHAAIGDFTDFQGIGSDPLYRRFESVKTVMRTAETAPDQFLSLRSGGTATVVHQFTLQRNPSSSQN